MNLSFPSLDDLRIGKTPAKRRRDTLTRQRLAYMQQRQAAIDALSEEERKEYLAAMASLKESFLSISRGTTLDGSDGKTQALAVRALSNMMPDEVVALHNQETRPHKKMFAAARQQIFWDQQCAEEQDPQFLDSTLAGHNFTTTSNAKDSVKKALQNFPGKRAYIAAYQQVEETIHQLVPPPYNSPTDNLNKAQRMEDGLGCIPPTTLLQWVQQHPTDDVAQMCDVATLGLQAALADHLANQPTKNITAAVVAGTAATTYVATNTPKGHYIGLGLAAVAGLLVFANLIKRARLKTFAKQARKCQQDQINRYHLHQMVHDLEQNPLPTATSAAGPTVTTFHTQTAETR